eukprot:1195974-Prorocentrum_minimum.AAC.5
MACAPCWAPPVLTDELHWYYGHRGGAAGGHDGRAAGWVGVPAAGDGDPEVGADAHRHGHAGGAGSDVPALQWRLPGDPRHPGLLG